MSKYQAPPVVRSDKKFWLSFSKKQVIGFILVFCIIGGGAIFYKTFLAKGANYSWFQTDWSGGASTTAIASHATDQTGWNKYSSKDILMSTTTDGQLTLDATSATSSDTTTSDFSAGTSDNVYVENGTVKLKKPNGLTCTAGTECTSGYCVSSVCNNLAVGDTYQGGIVFYVSDGHGLIARTADESTNATWGCYGTSIGAGAQSNTNGAANTTAVDTACTTTGIAAHICENLSSGDYSDWYLPAKDQLNTLYAQRAAVGGFTTLYYWSSTESNSTNAWLELFGDGSQTSVDKSRNRYVRCIRSF